MGLFREGAASARLADDGIEENSSEVIATVVSLLLDEGNVGQSTSNNDAEQQPLRERKAMITAPAPRFDVESNGGGLAAVKLRTEVARPRHSVVLARPMPFEPITDPFAWVCDIARRPKFGHQYVLCPGRPSLSRRQGGHNRVGLSVGPHWSGVIYTISIIAVATLFLTKFIMKDLPPWHQPVTVMCSLLTVTFLLATAVVDPGIVVESGEESAGVPFCEVCSIWRPEDAEHCEECGVCVFGMDHHCPWMGKCVGRGNILWFRLFNGSWMCLLIFVMASIIFRGHDRPSLWQD